MVDEKREKEKGIQVMYKKMLQAAPEQLESEENWY